MPKYKNNMIKEAIIRLDFESPINELKAIIPTSIENLILKKYSQKETNEGFNEEIRINSANGNIERIQTPFKDWSFWGNSKSQRICISENFVFVSHQNYLSFEDFYTTYETLIKELFKLEPELKIKRVGIRYINNIELDDDEPMKWDDYINKNLLSSLNINKGGSELTRTVQILELNYPKDDINIKYQYGMHNPDYPAPIKRKIYLMDIDGYKTGSICEDELIYLIPEIHKHLEELFEDSILDNLREIYNG